MDEAVGADAAVRNQRMVSSAGAEVARLRKAWEAEPAPQSAMPLLVAMRAAGRTPTEIDAVVAATRAEESFDRGRSTRTETPDQAQDFLDSLKK